MEFFSKAYTWLADLSSKLPKIDFKAFFIVVIVAVLLAGAVTFATYFASRAFRLKRACKRVIRYLSSVDAVNDDNVSEFTAQCFSIKVPQSLRDAWVQYLGVRFGYPSEILSEHNVFDVEVKKTRDLRPAIFIGVALVIVGIFAFWGFGTLGGKEMAVVHCAGLLLSGGVFLGLTAMSHKQYKSCAETFHTMLEDLDAKVYLQVDRSFAMDSSPLTELSAILEGIVARNTYKDVEVKLPENTVPGTPLEELIQQADGNSDKKKKKDEKDKIVSTYSPKPLEQNFDFDNAEGQRPSAGSGSEGGEKTSDVGTVNDGNENASEEQLPLETVSADDACRAGSEQHFAEAASDVQPDLDERPSSEEDVDFAILDGDEIEKLIKEIVREELERVSPDEQKRSQAKPMRVVYMKSKDRQKTEDEEKQRLAEGKAQPTPIADTSSSSRLSRLPELIRLMSERNMTRAMKMNIAKMLVTAYKSFEDRPEDKKVIVNCLNTVIKSLQEQEN